MISSPSCWRESFLQTRMSSPASILTVAFAVCLLALPADAAPVTVKPAVPAVPAEQSGRRKPAGGLIDSELNGLEMTFLAKAIELGETFRYLVSQMPRTRNPDMQNFGEDLVKTLIAQNAVLKTVAEMRKIKVPDDDDAPEHRLAAKLGKLEGVKLQKMLLDSFREADRLAIATYELGAKSEDPTIRNLAEQTLPKFREHLALVETMTGIRPAERPASRPDAQPPVEPGFK